MRRHPITIRTVGPLMLAVGLSACGGSRPKTGGDDPGSTGKRSRKLNDAGEFSIAEAGKSSRPKQAKLTATESEAAVRFFVVDKDKGPIAGIVIALTSPGGEKYYTRETDTEGFAEVLLPIGNTYELTYLSLGRRRGGVAARVKVANEPNLNLKLTMRYQREEYPTGDGMSGGFVLGDVQFETGKATITRTSHARLDTVVEYMKHKQSARIEISGHTDNVGGKKSNKRLSQRRANAVRKYLVSKGIDASRITAVGYGDERPIAPNDASAGRQRNRRIEATEL